MATGHLTVRVTVPWWVKLGLKAFWTWGRLGLPMGGRAADVGLFLTRHIRTELV